MSLVDYPNKPLINSVSLEHALGFFENYDAEPSIEITAGGYVRATWDGGGASLTVGFAPDGMTYVIYQSGEMMQFSAHRDYLDLLLEKAGFDGPLMVDEDID